MKKITLLLSGILLVSLLFGQQSGTQNNLSKLINADCGMQNVKPNTLLRAKQKNNATKYKFKVVNNSIGYSELIVRNTNNFKLKQLATLPQANEKYKVKVKYKKNGNWSNWGQVCNIKTQTLKTTQLKQQYCGATNVFAADILKFKKVPFATNYEVVAFVDSLGYDTINTTLKEFTLNDFTNIYYRFFTNYTITITPYSNGVKGSSVGQSCTMSTAMPPPCVAVNGCNLVENGDFSNYNPSAPSNFGQIHKACFWDSEGVNYSSNLPTYFSVHGNYFHIDATNTLFSVPDNSLTSITYYQNIPQLTEKGTGYASVVLANNFNQGYSTNQNTMFARDYLGQSLNQVMQAGKNYFCSFYTALPGGVPSSTNGLGMQFSNGKPMANATSGHYGSFGNPTYLDVFAFNSNQIHVANLGTPFTNYGIWNRVSGLVQGNNYDYLTIGNVLMYDDPLFQKMYIEPTNSQGSISPKAFIDNVEVYDVTIPTDITICLDDDLALNVLPNACIPSVVYYWIDSNNPTYHIHGLAQTIANANIASNYTLYMVINPNDPSTDLSLGTVNILYYQDQLPTITGVPTLCKTDPSEQYTVSANGGAWSSSTCGSCISAGGLFNPTIAGVGNHTIDYTTINSCYTSSFNITVIGAYNCCLPQNLQYILLNDLNGAYNNTTNPLPAINDGDNIILDGDVVINSLNLNWTNVNVYAESYITIPVGGTGAGTVTGSHLILESCKATFTSCTFQSACDDMWGGIVIEENTRLKMIGTSINDAIKAISLSNYNTKDVYIDNCNFTNNYYSIYIDLFEKSFPINITNSIFDSDNLDMKLPYNNYYTEAHLFFKQGIYDSPLTINGNQFKNCKFGIQSGESYELGMTVEKCEFNNCFVAGVWCDRYYYPHTSSISMLEMNDCNFYFPISVPSTSQFFNAVGPITTSKGIYMMHGNLLLTSANMYGNTVNDIGVDFENPYRSITVDMCNFKSLDIGINLLANGVYYEQYKGTDSNGDGKTILASNQAEITITSNSFYRIDKSINFEDNTTILLATNLVAGTIHPGYGQLPQTINHVCPTCPIQDISLVKQTISCNDFIRNDGITSYAIYVEPNTLMQNIGDCNTAPAGNEIQDVTNTMRSIWNLGSGFNYARFNNENFASTFTPLYYSFPYNNVNFTCNYLPEATDATCPGKPGILERVAGGNGSGESYGYEPDNRYKNNHWFIGSGLGNALPNPASNHITIPITLSEESTNAKLIVYSSIGRKALIEVMITDSGNIQVDVSQLEAGMYFYSLMINNAIVDTKKLVIRK